MPSKRSPAKPLYAVVDCVYADLPGTQLEDDDKPSVTLLDLDIGLRRFALNNFDGTCDHAGLCALKEAIDSALHLHKKHPAQRAILKRPRGAR